MLSYFLLNKKGIAIEVLPTPDYPVSKIGFLYSNKIYKIFLYFKVSSVGTIIEWN